MARPLDHEKRAQLLASVVRYIGEHGLAGLSLRPLAAELNTSSRMLIYYFGCKEELLIQALATHRPNLKALFADVEDAGTLRARIREMWTLLATGEAALNTKVLLQVMGVATVQDQGPFVDYASSAIDALVGALSETLERIGHEAEATVVATTIVSGLRGILLDRLVTGDVDRTENAAFLLIDRMVA